MNDDVLLVDEKDRIVTLTLNRPRVMNALNRPLLDALKNQVEEIRSRPDVRVVIITGAGDRAFCAGADLKERITMTEPAVTTFLHGLRYLFTAIETLNKPVIAAVNGLALGGGTELALVADIRLAARTATMGLTETKLAIIPGGGGTQRLPRLIGIGRAKELIFTGRRVDAGEAEKMGLINQVVAPEALLTACHHLAAMICENGPIAIEQAKHAIHYGMETDLATGLAIEANAYRVTLPTEDRKEGLLAFREKRTPDYKGK